MAIGEGVSLRGLYDTKYNHTMNISGVVSRTTDLSKAMSQDKTAANTAKLCAAGDKIIGALFSYEDRTVEAVKVGTISRKGYFEFGYTGANPAIGDGVVGGATAGLVAGTTAAAVPGQPAIWSVDTVAKTVVVEVGL